jgi:Kef-type K+ transport system membrane component KefB
MIVGAFAAGAILHPTPQRVEIEGTVTMIGHFFVPIFFAAVGASVDVRALARPEALALGSALFVVGVAGKVLAGFAAWRFDGNRLLVGVAMIPRGEVGLIFAQLGLATAAIGPSEFGALMLVVAATTLLTPPLLARLARVRGTTGEHAAGDGVDELVAGTHRATPRATQPVRREYSAE